MGEGWKKRYSRVSEGSYTVEAVVLLPVLLAVIVALMQICFILYDRTVVRGSLELTALQAAEEEAGQITNKDLDKDTLVPAEMEKQLLISAVKDAGIRETRTGVEVFVKLESRRIVPLYFGSGDTFVKVYSATRKKQYAKEKTILSEVLLDTLHLLE